LKGIKGGNDEGAVKVSRPGSTGAVGKTELTSGSPMSAVGREKAPRAEDVNPRRKRTSAFTPTVPMG
jgi:hypothetical protein